MKIVDFKMIESFERIRCAATLVYENSDRAPVELFYETDAAHRDIFKLNPDAFLLAGFFLATRHGERRVLCEDEVCPVLLRGIGVATRWFHHWQGESWPVIPIEAPVRRKPRTAEPDRQAGMFFSGGIDSMATLRLNHLTIPTSHPAHIKYGILVDGFDMKREDTFEAALASARTFSEAAGLKLIAVRTNAHAIDPALDFWINYYHSAALASVGHLFQGILNLVYIASSDDIPMMHPWGSHPLIDPNFSSQELLIRHDGIEYSRFEKTRLVAGWDEALRHLRVCTANPPGELNCGRCEKCVRTLIALYVLGVLDKASSFADNELSAEKLQHLEIRSAYQEACYRDLLEPLAALGRFDAVKAIRKAIPEYHRYQAWLNETDWKGAIKKFDRHYLGGSLSRAVARLRNE